MIKSHRQATFSAASGILPLRETRLGTFPLPAGVVDVRVNPGKQPEATLNATRFSFRKRISSLLLFVFRLFILEIVGVKESCNWLSDGSSRPSLQRAGSRIPARSPVISARLEN